MTDLRTLALAADQRADAETLPWRVRCTVPLDGERDFIAAASPAVVLALLDAVDAARGLVDVVEPADIPTLSREQLDAFLALRAALAAWEEGK